MREIKFRAWDTKSQQYIYVGNIDFVNNSVDGLPFKIQEAQDGISIHSLDFIEQYTGLKDKNDHPIYEGDILGYEKDTEAMFESGETERIIVTWSEEEARFITEFFSVYGGEGCCGGIASQQLHNLLKHHDCVLIGNIHETPELLK